METRERRVGWQRLRQAGLNAFKMLEKELRSKTKVEKRDTQRDVQSVAEQESGTCRRSLGVLQKKLEGSPRRRMQKATPAKYVRAEK